ncbi:hypothetical protein D4764_04G0000050 [Takifugu flavidus]|uniref:Uncharacterized protein n=1 Tax=Takifugu flavidus TaxID=433684 RepID=A0A5C6N374_9TELE|nr:hypothetical protein D4764_04G0000050 [Takifugu flavidus]
MHPSIHPSIHLPIHPSIHPPPLIRARPGGSPGIPRPVERHRLSNVSLVFPGVSYQRDTP